MESHQANAALRRERVQRNWRQQDLADQVGTTATTVRRWEQGSHQPSAYFRVKLCALFGKSAAELGLLEEAPLSSEQVSQAREEGDVSLYSTGMPLARKRDYSDRGRLLRWLQRDYQCTMEASLEHLTWITPGLAEQADAVRNAAHLLQRRAEHSERALPTGTSILDVYDQAEEALLVLGNPGAGKSTLLHDLALRLLIRAQNEETHPLPIILPLSSWAASKADFTDWIEEQLTRIYDVPQKLGRAWIEQGQILPLLDGLDEMEEAARAQCIAAINGYRLARVTPLVVCSRRAEYHEASVQQRLILQQAVLVQPASPGAN